MRSNVYNSNDAVYFILALNNLRPAEKLVLIQLDTLNTFGPMKANATKCAEQIGYTRQGWARVAKDLIKKGYVTSKKRGVYELTYKNIF
jgi:predicted transcriptional regulator